MGKKEVAPQGELFEHHKGGLYRLLFVACKEEDNETEDERVLIMKAMNATNDEKYEEVPIFATEKGRVITSLPYHCVVYVSQKTLGVYVRKNTEFYGKVGKKFRFERVKAVSH